MTQCSKLHHHCLVSVLIENQDDDALGRIEQQQALSFWICPQHEWEPQMMSKDKGTSIKVGTQMLKMVPIGDLGTKN